jgi:hypothetical protein
MALKHRLFFPVMVDARIDQYPLEPAFQTGKHFMIPVFFELSNILEQFYKPFIHDFFRFFTFIGVSVTDLQRKPT